MRTHKIKLQYGPESAHYISNRFCDETTPPWELGHCHELNLILKEPKATANVQYCFVLENSSTDIELHRRHENGIKAQTNDGKLLVSSGTIVHMECLFMRRQGTPEWKIQSTSGRTYPQVSEILIYSFIAD